MRSAAGASSCLLVAVVLLQLAAAAQAATSLQLLGAIRADVDFLRTNVWRFWARHGLDQQHGGFHATLSRNGSAVAPTDKGLVQQTRHAW